MLKVYQLFSLPSKHVMLNFQFQFDQVCEGIPNKGLLRKEYSTTRQEELSGGSQDIRNLKQNAGVLAWLLVSLSLYPIVTILCLHWVLTSSASLCGLRTSNHTRIFQAFKTRLGVAEITRFASFLPYKLPCWTTQLLLLNPNLKSL